MKARRLFMGLARFSLPLARRPVIDRPDDGLTAIMDVDVLDGHALLAAGPVALQNIHLCRVGPCQAVEAAIIGL